MEARPLTLSYPQSVTPSLDTALERFAPISLDQMNGVSLMRRVDTKYVIHRAQLPTVLAAVSNRYAILEIEGHRVMRYTSQYFDTAAFRFFNDHHDSRAKRTKVRIRRYVESELTFLEIKRKTVKGVTKKRRIPFEEFELTPDGQRFIDETFESTVDSKSGRTAPSSSELHPTVRNRFRRITLVDTGRSERVTIDWDLTSSLASVDYEHANLVIIEVKQEGHDRHAPIMQVLKAVGARPFRVSKYCLGMTCLVSRLKSNRFKKKLLRIGKVTSEPLN